MVDDQSWSGIPRFVLYSFELCEHYCICEVKNVLRKIKVSNDHFKSKFRDCIYLFHEGGPTEFWFLVIWICIWRVTPGFWKQKVISSSLWPQWRQIGFPDILFHSFSSIMRKVATQEHIRQCVYYKLVSRESFTEYHCLHMFYLVNKANQIRLKEFSQNKVCWMLFLIQSPNIFISVGAEKWNKLAV